MFHLISCLLIFGVILFLFKSLKLTLFILMISVLDISVNYIALFLKGKSLNVISYIGLIMFVSIIGENAIFTYMQLLMVVLPTFLLLMFKK